MGALATLPPGAAYAILGALALLENVFPPVPGDVVVALGAFLSIQGAIDPVTLFLVCWSANVGGAAAVYLLARKVGGTLFESRLGRRILSPEAIASIERGYIRYGLAGVFFGRLLPGVRAVVAPFAGLVRLSPARALLPIAAASALWFSGIIVIGRTIGRSWDRIVAVLNGLNTGLAIAGAVVAVALLLGWLRARAARRARLWEALRAAIGHAPSEPGAVDPALQAVAAFVLELAEADEHLADAPRAALIARLRKRFTQLPSTAVADRAAVEAAILRATATYSDDQRAVLVDRMRGVAEADGVVSPEEAAMLARAASLLGVEHP